MKSIDPSAICGPAPERGGPARGATAHDELERSGEPDCQLSLPSYWDIEPEQCFCLVCGEALPCLACPTKSTTTKEMIPHV